MSSSKSTSPPALCRAPARLPSGQSVSLVLSTVAVSPALAAGRYILKLAEEVAFAIAEA